jgi:transcriptional regulator with XRE-family HTH domain
MAMADGGKSPRDIARRLDALMQALEMNQTAFAAMTGIQQSALNNYLGAKRRLWIDQAMKIRAKTGVTLDWIYEGDRSGLPARLLAVLPPLDDDQTEERA